jgi:signal transduction histidine kinase
VQWIAHAHGGEVRVESTPGAGTIFEVRFKAENQSE